jgi:hypothetical protein
MPMDYSGETYSVGGLDCWAIGNWIGEWHTELKHI